MNQMILERNNSFTTIRKKFHHLALLGGAQFAANLTVDNTEGQLFVSVMNQWLWSSPSGLGSRTFTDQELERLLSPLEVCQTLLDSAEDTLIGLKHKMNCVCNRVISSGTAPLGRSQCDVILSELFAPPVDSYRPHSTSVM
jgi:hypothetical protein